MPSSIIPLLLLALWVTLIVDAQPYVPMSWSAIGRSVNADGEDFNRTFDHLNPAMAINPTTHRSVVAFSSDGQYHDAFNFERSSLKVKWFWSGGNDWDFQLRAPTSEQAEIILFEHPVESERFQFEPSIACDLNNMAFIVVWAGKTANGDYDIFFAMSTNDGVTWANPGLLDFNGATDGASEDDLSPRIFFDQRTNTWYTAWLSSQQRLGAGADVDVALSMSTNGTSWSSFIWANPQYAVDTEDEDTIRLVPGLKMGTLDTNVVHVIYHSYHNHTSISSNEDGDIFLVTFNTNLSLFEANSSLRLMYPARNGGPHDDLYDEYSFDAVSTMDGKTTAIVYRVVGIDQDGSTSHLVRVCRSLSGGFVFENCVSVFFKNTAGEPNNVKDVSPSINTDNRGMFVVAFTTSRDYYTSSALSQSFRLKSNLASVFYSVASSTANPYAAANVIGAMGLNIGNYEDDPGGVAMGWTRPEVLDVYNQIDFRLDVSGGNAGRLVLIHDACEGWTVVMENDQSAVQRGDGVFQDGDDVDIFYSRWFDMNSDVCQKCSEGTALTAYCPKMLQNKINALPRNDVNEKTLLISGYFYFGIGDHDDASNPIIEITGGRRVLIRRACAQVAVQWPLASRVRPRIIIGDNTSAVHFPDINLWTFESGPSVSSGWFINNIGATAAANMLIRYHLTSSYEPFQDAADNTIRMKCPYGFRPPEVADGAPFYPDYCTPSPEGVEVGVSYQNSTSPTTTCAAGRYCPPSTFNSANTKCAVFRYYTSPDMGMVNVADCQSHGTACEAGFWCPPGILQVDHIRMLTDTSVRHADVDVNIIFPNSFATSFDFFFVGVPPVAYTCSNMACTNDYGSFCRNFDYQCHDLSISSCFHSIFDPLYPGDCSNVMTYRTYYGTHSGASAPTWLVVDTAVAGDYQGFKYTFVNGMGLFPNTATAHSEVSGVSVTDVVRVDITVRFYAPWVTYPFHSQEVILPVDFSIQRGVTMVVFLPPTGITSTARSDAEPTVFNESIVNLGCTQGLDWTAQIWDCTAPRYTGTVPAPEMFDITPLLFSAQEINTSFVEIMPETSSGQMIVGRADPAVMSFKLYPRRVVSDASAVGYSTSRACVRVKFFVMGTEAIINNDLPIVVNTFRECPPGSFSETGTSEFGECRLCDRGTYTNSTGSITCRVCPEFLPRSSLGARSINECKAAPGTFKKTDGSTFSCLNLPILGSADCLEEGLTIETLHLMPGFWRATNTSTKILRCANAAFCRGGRSSDAPNASFASINTRRLLADSLLPTSTAYCIPHHLGPMCAICEVGYVRRGTGLCQICDDVSVSGDKLRLGWTIFAAAVILVLAFLLVNRSRIQQFSKDKRASFVVLAYNINQHVRRVSITHSDPMPANGLLTPNTKPTAAVSDMKSDNNNVDPNDANRPSRRFRGLSHQMSKRLGPLGRVVDKNATLLWKWIIEVEGNTTIRILVSLFQVLAGMSTAFNFLWPPIFIRIVAVFNALSAEIFYNLDTACLIRTNLYLSIALGMISPLVAVFIIVFVHFVFERRLRKFHRVEDIPKLRAGSYSLFLILLFLVYPGVSSTVISAFVCREFDDGSRWLRKDITVSCDAPDRAMWTAIAGFGIGMYVVGIPLIYFLSLWFWRRDIDPIDPNEVPDENKFSHVLFLINVYKRRFWFFEIVELFRKLVQTSLILFFMDGSVIQFVIIMSIAGVFIQVFNELKPYVSDGANRLASVAQWEIFIVAFLGLLFRVDLVTLDSSFSYDRFATMTGCLVAACFLAPIYALYQLREKIFHGVIWVSYKIRRKTPPAAVRVESD